jgi:glutamate synthase domain-containing protein 2
MTSFDSATIMQIRKANPRAPLSVRVPATRNAEEIALELATKGVDVIHLTANYHGQGLDARDPMLLKDYIRSVHRRLVKECLRDRVTLIASGGITLAEHVPKAVACGADLVALDTTVLVALQAQFQGECRTPDEGRIEPEQFDSTWGANRLANMMASWHDQLIEVLSAMGIRDVRRLRGDVGRVMFNEDLEREAFADILDRS